MSHYIGELGEGFGRYCLGLMRMVNQERGEAEKGFGF
jgi:hypothetical protein